MAATPVRGIKSPDEEWLPFLDRAYENGETGTDVLRRAIRNYGQSYRAEIYRDGKWWMIRAYLSARHVITTQARDESEVWLMAREVIAVNLDLDPNTINVELVILPTAKEEAS